MSDIGYERRRHWVEERLDALGFLSRTQRNFLGSILMQRGSWHVLVERTAGFPPSGRAAGFVVGRAGVFALVFTEVVPTDAQLYRIRRHAEETFANLTSGRRQYVPHMLELMLLMPAAPVPGSRVPFVAVDPTTVADTVRSSETKLAPKKAREIAATVDARVSRYELISTDAVPAFEAPSEGGLFAPSDLQVDERAKALERPFEEWMTFLDPNQIALVQRNFNGPARFSGPAGTGKTVVALHRMAHFAKNNPGQLLFLTFVRTLPRYLQSGFTRLAPHSDDRVEFIGLHGWARAFLEERGKQIEVVEGNVNNAFGFAWKGARDLLTPIEPSPNYWEDEVQRVIKGRGITDLEGYQRIDRRGRNGITLDGTQREIVWANLYEPYERYLRERGTNDHDDRIRHALEELKARPLDEPYGLVTVDEVQDFTLNELALAHQIAGGSADAQLLLVGDGQQQIYAGGWRLSDAGIPIVGRGNVLRINYRNRSEVLDFAQGVHAINTVDDLDGSPGFVLRDSHAVLPGGHVRTESVTRSEAGTTLARAIRDSKIPLADIAVITRTNKEEERYREALREAGIHTASLKDYDGTRRDEVKVGTVYRAKGMDFAAVFHITEKPNGAAETHSAADRDRAELAARQLMVVHTRARDYLWVGTIND